ncbi:phosphatidate cytidylyltransferase [Desmospora profundinema]|uniref:Phosphatidate cytidylyltransferase n=1 Tax=Desmospora profundinema TaxID=1571184 RepID=A0ABU1IHF8_9BACL|nr:phosphatidate cytidylyltransferase [Desmospora profundinema]MDR6224203.1 phosphatidate cytidylyltransferase [Desmospora profundinema]
MKQRIVTGVLGGGLFLAVLAVGGWPYALMVTVLATIGYVEFCRMKGIRWSRPQAWAGFATLWLILLTGLSEQAYLPIGGILEHPTNILAGMILFFLWMVASRNHFTIGELAYLFLGSLYIGYGFSYMIQARLITDGLAWSLLAVLVTFASDTGAYFIGKRLGNRKLWPSISPNKTVEGSLGGILASLLVSVAVALIFPQLGTVAFVVAVGLLIGVAGQFGDLIESAIKRSAGVKDSGALLPGHGGVLDRFDSLLLVFPVLHLAQLI